MKRICSVENCTRPAHCRGWCEAHYCRWRRHGDVMADEPIGSPHSGSRTFGGTTRAKPGPFDLDDSGEL